MLERERLHVAGGRVDWYVHYANQYGGSLKLSKWNLAEAPATLLLAYPADSEKDLNTCVCCSSTQTSQCTEPVATAISR